MKGFPNKQTESKHCFGRKCAKKEANMWRIWTFRCIIAALTFITAVQASHIGQEIPTQTQHNHHHATLIPHDSCMILLTLFRNSLNTYCAYLRQWSRGWQTVFSNFSNKRDFSSWKTAFFQIFQQGILQYPLTGQSQIMEGQAATRFIICIFKSFSKCPPFFTHLVSFWTTCL